MPVHINSLPDDCLLTFFDLIPLADLLRLDRVCHRWASLLSSACARRQTLTLIFGCEPVDETYFSIPFNDNMKICLESTLADGSYNLPVLEQEASLTLPYLMPVTSFDEFLLDEYVEEYDDEDGFFDILYGSSLGGSVDEVLTELARLHTAHLSDHLGVYLAELFPNVSTLVVIHVKCYEAELRSMIDLLGHWSLKIAKLWIRTCDIELKFEHRPDNHPIHALLLSINRQASLQQLTLDFDKDSWTTDQFTIPLSNTFSFIDRLKVAKLNLGWYDGRNALWHSMHRFRGSELRHLGLGSCEEPLLMETVLNPQFEFTSKVHQLYFEWSFETVGKCGQFCERFPSLTMLRVNWSRSNITFAGLVINLASLLQLTHLMLYIDFEVRPENAFALVNRVDDGEEPRISLSQVKNLELMVEKRSHQDLEPFCPLVFPSVEVIVLWNYFSNCTTCRPYINGPNDIKTTNRCHRLLILSLKDKFPSASLYAKRFLLESSFVDYTNYVRTMDDALPEIGCRNDAQPAEEQVGA